MKEKVIRLREYIDSIAHQIFDRLESIESKLDGYKKHVIDGREMIDNTDICKILKISKRSIYKHRKNGKLCPRKFGGKLYYDIDEVKALMRKIME